jgi:D-beta-D-heptose 7-phosphate kinase/D-beta-D-heptose 1-phosphate adenosyltransferase
MNRTELNQALKEFHGKKILVIGDLILDKYLFGKVKRISPEAPVPILRVEEEKFVLGGAANTAANINALGGKAVLCGFIGKDEPGKIFEKLLKKKKILSLIIKTKKKTIRKVRALDKQQLIRIDFEEEGMISGKERNLLEKKALKKMNFDAIVFSDYAKETINEKIYLNILRKAKKKKIPVIVDPKPSKNWFFKGCTIMTPNEKEAFELAYRHGVKAKGFTQLGKKLSKKLRTELLVTRSKKGMTLFKGNKKTDYSSKAIEVFDVTGAGDTVTAVIALGKATKAENKTTIQLANIAASIVIKKLGTAVPTIKEMNELLVK